MAFYLGKHLAFIDSFQFMSQSLQELSSNLTDEKFIYTKAAFQGEKLALMKKESIHMTTWIAVKSLMKPNYLIKKIFTIF